MGGNTSLVKQRHASKNQSHGVRKARGMTRQPPTPESTSPRKPRLQDEIPFLDLPTTEVPAVA